MWAKELNDGSRAVVLLNRGDAESAISFKWTDIRYPMKLSASIRDLWAHKDEGKKAGDYSAAVPSHGVVMLSIRP